MSQHTPTKRTKNLNSQLITSKGWAELKISPLSPIVYFEGNRLFQTNHEFFKTTADFSYFLEDLNREDIFTCVPEFIVLMKKSVRPALKP